MNPDDYMEFPTPLKDVPPSDNEGSTLEPGEWYDAEVVSISGKLFSTNRNPYSKVRFRCEEGVHAEKYFLTAPSLWRWRQLISACGYDPDTMTEAVWDKTVLIGQQVRIMVKQDGDYVNLDKIKRPDGVEKSPWPAPQTAHVMPQSMPDNAGPTEGDEDLPF